MIYMQTQETFFMCNTVWLPHVHKSKMSLFFQLSILLIYLFVGVFLFVLFVFYLFFFFEGGDLKCYTNSVISKQEFRLFAVKKSPLLVIRW